jgi:hypothetical protein
MKQDGLRILGRRSQRDYANGHIPGLGAVERGP